MTLLIRIAIALLMAATALSTNAQNGRRSADCVELVDSTCVKGRAKQTLVWPSPAPTPEVIGGLPPGYVERTLTLGPADIDGTTYQLARDFGGWPTYTCIFGAGPSANTRCTDGRFYSSLRAASCSGIYEKKLYAIFQDTTYCPGVGDGAGPCSGGVALQSYRSCAAPGSAISYLVKDSGAGNITTRTLTASQIRAYRSTADAVSGDSATSDAICRAYGGVSTYSASIGRFSSCGDNTLMAYRSGTWVRIGACSGGSQTLDGLVCSFAN